MYLEGVQKPVEPVTYKQQRKKTCPMTVGSCNGLLMLLHDSRDSIHVSVSQQKSTTFSPKDKEKEENVFSFFFFILLQFLPSKTE